MVLTGNTSQKGGTMRSIYVSFYGKETKILRRAFQDHIMNNRMRVEGRG